MIFAVDRFELLECLVKIYLKPLSDLHQVSLRRAAVVTSWGGLRDDLKK